MKYKIGWLLLFILLLSACQKIYPERLEEEKLETLREQYPYDDGWNPLLDVRKPELSAYVDIAHAYVKGKVKEVGYTDWKGSWRYYPLQVEIESIIYNTELDLKEGEVITVRMADYEYEYCILEYPNEYTFLIPLASEEYQTTRFGWYYVTEDDHVLSVMSKGDLDDYSGWSLEEFSDTLCGMKEE